ncbi:hypothetical protein [Conexibacter arvalis]|uniref:Uncharacterized protein n=1 Tax=Conexibacter arvalis TaxID=912552 RepID=A0A840IGI5_9ACTN|nr:hypothetical protein [Conexibacter arvalis]MBB4663078.1 hypothetical protein [Conexibacter arvalis]
MGALLLAAAGCGGSSDPPPHPADLPPTPRERAEAREAAKRPPAPRCPAGAGNCRAAEGRVIGLESVDPDGDGDLHLILTSAQSITLPGITVLDINKDLRPARDPKIGDWAAGAGPVYTGSYGQSQIQVDAVEVWPRR